MRLLAAGRHVELSNGDVAKQLLKVMQKFGDRNMPQMEVYAAIDSWAEKEKAKVKARAHGTIDDKVECMRLFAGQGDDLGGALGYINHLINSWPAPACRQSCRRTRQPPQSIALPKPCGSGHVWKMARFAPCVSMAAWHGKLPTCNPC